MRILRRTLAIALWVPLAAPSIAQAQGSPPRDPTGCRRILGTELPGQMGLGAYRLVA